MRDHDRRTIGEIVELAQAQLSRRSFREQVLQLLQERVGFDGGIMDTLDPSEDLTDCASLACDSRLIERAAFGWASCYGVELAPLFAEAARQGDVVVDSRVFGARDRRRRRYYGEVLDPLGFGHTLWVHLRVRGRIIGNVGVGRPPRSRPFEDRYLALVRALAPTLALADASFRPSVRPPCADSLSAREREIASLVGLGYTNIEIAMALGTSPNTVRNQLVSIFRKVDVTTRAELAGLFGRTTAPR